MDALMEGDEATIAIRLIETIDRLQYRLNRRPALGLETLLRRAPELGWLRRDRGPVGTVHGVHSRDIRIPRAYAGDSGRRRL